MADIDHGTLVTWINESDDATQESRELSEKCRDYYDSRQLDPAEIAALKKRNQAPVVINRIKPKMDTLMGMEKGAKTTAKAFPRTPKHEKASEAATEAIRFVLQDNDFDQKRSQTWENILIEGTGGCEVIVKPAKKGFKILINHIMWDRLIYDPHSRRKDFSDARYLGQVIWMDYDEAISTYPGGGDVLEDMQSGSQTYDDKPRWMDTTRKRVKIVQLYYRQDGEVWHAIFTRGGYLKDPAISPFKNEEGETEWPYEFASAFVDREGGRYGAALQLLDVQDEINKRRSKALHLMSVRQVAVFKGAVDDVNKLRQELAKPDGVVELNQPMNESFEILKTGDMVQAQFSLLTEAKMEIDAIGANAATQGKDKTVQSGIALQRRQQAGQTEIGPMFDVLKYWQYRVFKKVWNRVRQYWKEEMWIRVTDDNQNLRWVGLNKPVTKGEQMIQQLQEQFKQVPPERQQQAMPQLQQMIQQIQNDPMMKEIVETENDIAELDVDIILSEVPDVLTAQIEDFQVLGEMVKSGFPMPPLAVIEASPLSNKDKIIKMMKEDQQNRVPPQVQEQMKQMQEQMQKLGEENQQLKSGVQEAQMKLQARAEEKGLAAKMDMMEMNIEARLEQQRQESADRLAAIQMANDVQFEKWKALLEAETKLEVAQINKQATLESSQVKAAESAVQ